MHRAGLVCHCLQQALTFRCCAAVEEVASLNAELSAQIADFHDLLACLGQESAKVSHDFCLNANDYRMSNCLCHFFTGECS